VRFQITDVGSPRLAAVLPVFGQIPPSLGVWRFAGARKMIQRLDGLLVVAPSLRCATNPHIADVVECAGNTVARHVFENEVWIFPGVNRGKPAIHRARHFQKGIQLLDVQHAHLLRQDRIVNLDAYLPTGHKQAHFIVLQRQGKFPHLLAAFGHDFITLLGALVLAPVALDKGFGLTQRVKRRHFCAAVMHGIAVVFHQRARLGNFANRPQLGILELPRHHQELLQGQILFTLRDRSLSIHRHVFQNHLVAPVVTHGALVSAPHAVTATGALAILIALQWHIVLIMLRESVMRSLVDQAIGQLGVQRAARYRAQLVGQRVQLCVILVAFQDGVRLGIAHARATIRHGWIHACYLGITLFGVHGVQQRRQLFWCALDGG